MQTEVGRKGARSGHLGGSSASQSPATHHVRPSWGACRPCRSPVLKLDENADLEVGKAGMLSEGGRRQREAGTPEGGTEPLPAPLPLTRTCSCSLGMLLSIGRKKGPHEGNMDFVQSWLLGLSHGGLVSPVRSLCARASTSSSDQKIKALQHQGTPALSPALVLGMLSSTPPCKAMKTKVDTQRRVLPSLVPAREEKSWISDTHPRCIMFLQGLQGHLVYQPTMVTIPMACYPSPLPPVHLLTCSFTSDDHTATAPECEPHED